MSKINLLSLNHHQMRSFFLSLGEKTFRANQVMKWMYHYYCDDFNLMSNLNKSLRSNLTKYAEINAPEIIDQKKSIDGTIKWIMRIDNQTIETVYIPEVNRCTLCISSQIGCLLGCTFCSTAKQGFNRNLKVCEIIGQLWRAAKIINSNKVINNKSLITNVVLMGMGEPLLNLNNIVSAASIMLDQQAFGLSKRRITISTAGIAPAINKLAKMIDVSLAISLHAPNDLIRNQIMPINKKYNITTVLSSVKNYLNQTNANHGKITIEYVMLNDINDHADHAHQLAKLLKNIPSKINLIPWNAFPGGLYRSSSKSTISNFAKILINYGFTVIIRKIRGNDINAACGQLNGQVINRLKNIIH